MSSARSAPSRIYGANVGISPYLAGLRNQIGTDLLLVPTVAVLPRDEDGRVLLVRLSDTGQWATIGGAIDPDEAPEDAARREALEEANIEVRLLRLVVALGGPEYRIVYPNGDLTSCCRSSTRPRWSPAVLLRTTRRPSRSVGSTQLTSAQSTSLP